MLPKHLHPNTETKTKLNQNITTWKVLKVKTYLTYIKNE